MEQQLTNKEIARVFAMYIGCDAHFYYTNPQAIRKMTLHRMHQMFKHQYNPDVKLLLTPISKITDEHAIELCFLNGDPYAKQRTNKKQLIEYIKNNIDYIVNQNSKVFQYLIQQGYTVPLFISLNHPCNGKDAIELAIAIDRNMLS